MKLGVLVDVDRGRNPKRSAGSYYRVQEASVPKLYDLVRWVRYGGQFDDLHPKRTVTELKTKSQIIAYNKDVCAFVKSAARAVYDVISEKDFNVLVDYTVESPHLNLLLRNIRSEFLAWKAAKRWNASSEQWFLEVGIGEEKCKVPMRVIPKHWTYEVSGKKDNVRARRFLLNTFSAANTKLTIDQGVTVFLSLHDNENMLQPNESGYLLNSIHATYKNLINRFGLTLSPSDSQDLRDIECLRRGRGRRFGAASIRDSICALKRFRGSPVAISVKTYPLLLTNFQCTGSITNNLSMINIPSEIMWHDLKRVGGRLQTLPWGNGDPSEYTCDIGQQQPNHDVIDNDYSEFAPNSGCSDLIGGGMEVVFNDTYHDYHKDTGGESDVLGWPLNQDYMKYASNLRIVGRSSDTARQPDGSIRAVSAWELSRAIFRVSSRAGGKGLRFIF